MLRKFTPSGRRGFTLVEIILVTVIIMILVGIVGPKLVGKARIARINATSIQMQALKSSLQEFEIHASRFPTTQEGLEALIAKPGGLANDEWTGPYIEGKTPPKDKFGSEFDYKCPSDHGFDYDLISAGPDKTFGNDDDLYLFKEDESANL